MKYAVLLALLGSASTIQINTTPTQNRDIYEDHKQLANDVVATQASTEKRLTDKVMNDDKVNSAEVEKKKSEIEAQRYEAMSGNVSKLSQMKINPEAKKNATEVVGDQESMEKEVVSAVVNLNNTVDAKVKAEMDRIRKARNVAMNGGVALSAIDPAAKAEATAVVGEQQKSESESVTANEEANKQSSKDARKDMNEVRKARNFQMNGDVGKKVSLTQKDEKKGDPSLGASDEAFTIGKADASNVTSTQDAFMKAHNAMVKNNNDTDVANTNTKKWHDAAGRVNMMNGGVNPHPSIKVPAQYPLAALAEKDEKKSEPSLGASDESFTVGKAQAANVTATQDTFMKAHNAMVKQNNDTDVANTNTKKWHDAAGRVNMMNGGVNPHPSIKVPAQYPLAV